MDAQAGPGLTVLHAVGKIWFPEEGPCHRDELEAVVERAGDGVELVDAAEEDERHVQRGAELAREGQEEGFFERDVREDPPAGDAEAEADELGLGGDELAHRHVTAEVVHAVEQRATAGELERVEVTVRLEQPGDRQALVEPQPAGDAVSHVELGDDRHARRCRPPDGFDHPAREPRPVLDAAAVVVAALVEIRAEERAQQVVVTQVDLDAVEPRLGGQLGRAHEVGDHLVELSLGRAADQPHRGGAEPGGRRQRGLSVRSRVGHQPGVTQLRGRSRTVLVHRVHQANQSRQGFAGHDEGVAVHPPPG